MKETKKRKRVLKFKNKIQVYRENKDMSRKQLADGIGVSVFTIWQIETTKGFPRGDIRVKIMEFLGASFDDLFYEEVEG